MENKKTSQRKKLIIVLCVVLSVLILAIGGFAIWYFTSAKEAGFTDEEREKMTVLLDDGFIDTFRYFYPDQGNIYSWWSYRFKAREKNAGWRIDYFLTSESLKDKLVDAKIHTDIMGSDHCPVELDIDL